MDITFIFKTWVTIITDVIDCVKSINLNFLLDKAICKSIKRIIMGKQIQLIKNALIYIFVNVQENTPQSLQVLLQEEEGHIFPCGSAQYQSKQSLHLFSSKAS